MTVLRAADGCVAGRRPKLIPFLLFILDNMLTFSLLCTGDDGTIGGSYDYPSFIVTNNATVIQRACPRPNASPVSSTTTTQTASSTRSSV